MSNDVIGHMTWDLRHITCDRWHMTLDTQRVVNIVSICKVPSHNCGISKKTIIITFNSGTQGHFLETPCLSKVLLPTLPFKNPMGAGLLWSHLSETLNEMKIVKCIKWKTYWECYASLLPAPAEGFGRGFICPLGKIRALQGVFAYFRPLLVFSSSLCKV